MSFARSSSSVWLLATLLAAPSAAEARALAERPAARPVLSRRATDRFTQQLIAKERMFYRPGVAYDGVTGMTFDGHPIDPRSGELAGGARTFSAASKESLHLILLVKAIEGDPTARALLTPDPAHPERAVDVAVDVLQKKIATYRAFDRAYPGFGGFLPWYKIESGKMLPTDDWTDRVPGLDNGQLAWSLYHAVDALRRSGHAELAQAYDDHLSLMKRNVVRMFYDPAAKKMRAEAKLDDGSARAPGASHYSNNQANYFLDDPYEGLLLCHFADLFGDWKTQPSGKDAIWSEPRRKPATYRDGKQPITVVEGNWFSSHEDWGFLVLPFRDVPVADALFENAQKARTAYSAAHGWPGLFASTSRPSAGGKRDLGYLSALGVPSIAKEKVSERRVFAPYAAFPVALSNKRVFATWMKRMLETPGMWGKNGMGESFTAGGKQMAPILTWDGKALPMVALMGGIGSDIAAQLKRDGLYDGFITRTKADYRRFDAMKIEGRKATMSTPAN
jgi:hypothetical protein